MENENQMTDEVCSADQNGKKPNVHKLQELDKKGEAVVWELPSVATAEQLLSSQSTSEKKINKEESSIKVVAQATVGVKELLLLDPPPPPPPE